MEEEYLNELIYCDKAGNCYLDVLSQDSEFNDFTEYEAFMDSIKKHIETHLAKRYRRDIALNTCGLLNITIEQLERNLRNVKKS